MENQDLKIICPFCNKPYTGKMEDSLYASEGCETCGPEVGGTIDIICENCKKVVYRKEIN